MGKGQTAEILGCQIDLLSLSQALDGIKDLVARPQAVPAHIITVNAEIIYAAIKNTRLKAIINGARMVTPDGIGVVWAARQLGYKPWGRVTGIDLLEAVCREGAGQGWKIFLLGAAPGVAAAAGKNLQRKYPGLIITGTINGYFKPEETGNVLASIRKGQPDIIFVGLGAPRQEYWINENLGQLQAPVCIGIGGSFDVIAGLKKRAPSFMIKLNLEWLYRLISEPFRIKRQLALPKFVGAVLKEKFKKG